MLLPALLQSYGYGRGQGRSLRATPRRSATSRRRSPSRSRSPPPPVTGRRRSYRTSWWPTWERPAPTPAATPSARCGRSIRRRPGPSSRWRRSWPSCWRWCTSRLDAALAAHAEGDRDAVRRPGAAGSTARSTDWTRSCPTAARGPTSDRSRSSSAWGSPGQRGGGTRRCPSSQAAQGNRVNGRSAGDAVAVLALDAPATWSAPGRAEAGSEQLVVICQRLNADDISCLAPPPPTVPAPRHRWQRHRHDEPRGGPRESSPATPNAAAQLPPSRPGRRGHGVARLRPAGPGAADRCRRPGPTSGPCWPGRRPSRASASCSLLVRRRRPVAEQSNG